MKDLAKVFAIGFLGGVVGSVLGSAITMYVISLYI
jgi:hypothetical protein